MASQTTQLIVRSPQPKHSDSSRDSLIKEWLWRFSLNTSETLTSERAGALAALWLESFADIPDAVLEAAFRKTIKTCKFWPKVADIREHIDGVRKKAGAEAAEQKWTQLIEYIRVYVHPDIPNRGPRLSERTANAVRAAGGLAFIRECSTDNLQWAKKRFIESHTRWDELQQDEHLLPEGEVKGLLTSVASTMSVERVLEAPKATNCREERRA